MADIVTKFSSDDKEMIAAFQRQQREIDKLKTKLREAKDEGAVGQANMKRGADDLATSVAKVATQYLAVGAIASKVASTMRAEIEHAMKMNREFAKSQDTVADAQLNFFRNLGNVSAATRDQTARQIAEISTLTGVNQKKLYEAGSIALSARGDKTEGQALGFLHQAARIAPDDPASLVGGLLDVSTLTGSNDPRANAGFLTQMQSQARVASLDAISQNMVPAAIGVKSYGGSDSEAGALVATLTQAMKDQTGAKSGTLAQSLARQIADVTKGGVLEDVKALQADPSKMASFMKKGSFGEGESFVRDLLTSGSATGNLFLQNAAGYAPEGQRAGIAEQFIKGIRGGKLQTGATLSRYFDQTEESLQINQLERGSLGRMTEGVKKLNESSGLSGFATSMRGMAMGFETFFGADPIQQAKSMLRGRQAELRGDDPVMRGTDKGTGAMLAEKLDRMVGLLERIHKDKSKNINAQIE